VATAKHCLHFDLSQVHQAATDISSVTLVISRTAYMTSENCVPQHEADKSVVKQTENDAQRGLLHVLKVPENT
jgi:hypothetical protein